MKIKQTQLSKHSEWGREYVGVLGLHPLNTIRQGLVLEGSGFFGSEVVATQRVYVYYTMTLIIAATFTDISIRMESIFHFRLPWNSGSKELFFFFLIQAQKNLLEEEDDYRDEKFLMSVPTLCYTVLYVGYETSHSRDTWSINLITIGAYLIQK